MLEIQKFTKIIVANWKMNGSIKFIDNFLKQLKFNNNSTACTIICPPFTYIYYLSNRINNFYLGGQDCSISPEGENTGEVSGSMLHEIGCKFCIIGHSERRILYNETDKVVASKAFHSIKNDIHPIICVGETLEQKKNNQTKEVLTSQITKSFPTISTNNNTIIAYEPIWAIGSGLIPSFEEINKIHYFIKNEIPGYKDCKVLYGGSVKSTNSKEILNLDNVDGVLVGGSSLKVREFNKILLS